MEGSTSKILKSLMKIYGVLALAAIATYVISFVTVVYCAFSPQASHFYSRSFYGLKLNLLYFQFIRIPVEFDAWQLLLLLHVIFMASFFTSCKKFSIVNLIKEGDASYIKESFLILMPAISSSIFIVALAMHALFERVGVGVGGPSYEDPLIALLSLSYAVVSEEIGFRLVPILVPSAVYIFIKSKLKLRQLFLAIFKPGAFHLKDRALEALQFSLIFISAFLFSYAHVASDVWEVGKIPSSFIAGIAIGICAVRYGFDAAILMHWYFNYYWYALLLPNKLGLNLDFLFNISFSLAFYIALVAMLISIFKVKLLWWKK